MEERRPELVLDFHHQGSHVDDDGGLITGSTMWPNAEAEAEALGIADEFAETVTGSKRAVSVIAHRTGAVRVRQHHPVSQHEHPRHRAERIRTTRVGVRAVRDRGDIDAKSNGYIARTAEVAGMAVLEAVADGSWETASLEPVAQIRERGDYLPDLHE